MQPLWIREWRFLKKLTELPYKPVIPFQEKPKALIQKDTCTPVLTVALLTTAKT